MLARDGRIGRLLALSWLVAGSCSVLKRTEQLQPQKDFKGKPFQAYVPRGPIVSKHLRSMRPCAWKSWETHGNDFWASAALRWYRPRLQARPESGVARSRVFSWHDSWLCLKMRTNDISNMMCVIRARGVCLGLQPTAGVAHCSCCDRPKLYLRLRLRMADSRTRQTVTQTNGFLWNQVWIQLSISILRKQSPALWSGKHL